MATVDKADIVRIQNLYSKQNYSARMIAETLHYPLNAVYYAMRRHNIVRRDAFENRQIQFNRKPLSYALKTNLSERDRSLKLAGVMLYWTEGYKTAKSSGIDFANSDIKMVILFISFLRTICVINEDRLRVYLYCHDKALQNEFIDFWSLQLKVPKKQFTKPYIHTSGRVDKKGKMPYGLVHIRYADKKLLIQVLDWIEEYKSSLAD